MSTRRVRIVLLCEDSQHEAFVRRFLETMRWNTREIRVLKSPSGRGSAEQWVRERFADELKAYRQRTVRAASGLIVMIDADSNSIPDRINEFAVVCNSHGIPFRADEEAVAIGIPKRNIETWIHYLIGNAVDEQTDYPSLDRERGCKPAVERLAQLCNSTGLATDAPPSLTAACREYNTRIRPLSQ